MGLVRDQRQTSWLAIFRFPRTPSSAISSSSKKLEDHDVRVPILGMGREVAISRRIPVLVKATPNRHDLPRTVVLAPLLDLINGL